MKVGLLAVPITPFESFRTALAAAEELGVDSFWVPDHLLGVANPALWQEMKSTGVRVFALCPGATETEFFVRTGEEFLTSGRQTSQQVVDTAMAAIDKSTPTVVSGLKNTVLSSAYRYTPRKMMLAVSERIMKAN